MAHQHDHERHKAQELVVLVDIIRMGRVREGEGLPRPMSGGQGRDRAHRGRDGVDQEGKRDFGNEWSPGQVGGGGEGDVQDVGVGDTTRVVCGRAVREEDHGVHKTRYHGKGKSAGCLGVKEVEARRRGRHCVVHEGEDGGVEYEDSGMIGLEVSDLGENRRNVLGGSVVASKDMKKSPGYRREVGVKGSINDVLNEWVRFGVGGITGGIRL